MEPVVQFTLYLKVKYERWSATGSFDFETGSIDKVLQYGEFEKDDG
jgi:hypothetical protein